MRATEFTNSADQARELGLKVGDTIQSREAARGGRFGWHDARITLLWIGTTNTVWIASGRIRRPWSVPYESANWDLHDREWERIQTPPTHAAFLATLGEAGAPSAGACPIEPSLTA